MNVDVFIFVVIFIIWLVLTYKKKKNKIEQVPVEELYDDNFGKDDYEETDFHEYEPAYYEQFQANVHEYLEMN